jgi:uncharacterized membrane protein YccC
MLSSARQKLAFSLANTAAVIVALAIAFSQNFERPYWAMFTVFILAKPVSGIVRSKGVFRFVGTLVGAAITLFMIPPLVQSPILLCVAIGGWVGLCLYTSLLDRTPRSYAFMLAGYTATIIGFSVVNSPETIFDTCVSRLEEISVGILCGAVAHSVIFPQNISGEIRERVNRTVNSAAAYISAALAAAGFSHPDDKAATERLAVAVTAIHVLHKHIAFETSNVRRITGAMRALLDRIAVLPAHLTSVEKTHAALVAQGPLQPEMTAMLERGAHWATSFTADETTDVPPPPAFVLEPAVNAPSWTTLLEQSLTDDLNRLLAALHSARTLSYSLIDRNIPLSPALTAEVSQRFTRHLSRDGGLAILSAIAAAGAVFMACTLWIYASWPEGAVAAQFAAIGCSLFATLDKPTKPIVSTIAGILIALPVAAVYEFAVFPRIDGFVSLALVLSPILVLLSLMQTSEKLEGAALVIGVAFSGGLALQSSYRADFASFVNSNSAEVAGLIIAAIMVTVFRTVDPVWNAWRLTRSNWNSIIWLARKQHADVRGWYLQILDRIGLIAPRLKDTQLMASEATRIDPLRDLRVGLTLGELKVAQETSPASTDEVLTRVYESIVRYYQKLSQVGGRSEEIFFPAEIDAGIDHFNSQSSSFIGGFALIALTRLRLDLYPTAQPYIPLARVK